MNLKKIAALFAFLFPFLTFAQNATVKGILVNEKNVPLQNAIVVLSGTNYQGVSDKDGNFEIKNVVFGKYALTVQDVEFSNFSMEVDLNQTEINLSQVKAISNPAANNNESEVPTVSIEEEESESSSQQNVSSVLGASRDAFQAAATYNFSIARFKVRGYDDENFVTMMNGVQENDLYNGRAAYSSWSGLNDVLRSRETSYGLNPANYTFGGVGGAYNIDSRASRQRKQIQATYSHGNRTYDDRLMLTYGSGFIKSGWAFSASLSKRWASESFIKGTYYDSHSYYLGVTKLLNKHELSVTLLGSKVENARSSSNTIEVYDLTGDHYYNSNWGYQNGDVRNANIGTNQQPVVILSHEWKINNKSSLETALSHTWGKRGSTALNWTNAPDPRPTYYRYLPSYYQSYFDNDSIAYLLENKIKNNPELLQINWDAMLDANYRTTATTVDNVEGIAGNSVTGRRALYIIEDRITETKRSGFNTVFNTLAADNINVSAGINYQMQVSRFYKEVADLLGADFYLDVDKFAVIDFPGDPVAPQSDIRHPNRVVREGDRFGYDYEAHNSIANIWVQAVAKFSRVDVFGAISVSRNTMYRKGNYQNGLYTDNSYGKSQKLDFTDGGIKAGITYKLNGRNYILANSGFITRSPFFSNVFVSPRTRNTTVDNIKQEKISSVEGGYLLTAPRLKVRGMLYYTKFKDGTETKSYYFDNSFANFTLTGIEKVHTGAELSADANVGYGINVTAVAALGEYYYASRPLLTTTIDNSNEIDNANEEVYYKDLHIESTPQDAFALGVRYRSKKFWNVGLSANYFDNYYYDPAAARRTRIATDGIEAGSQRWNDVLSQQRESGQFTLDFSAGWSWKINNKFKALKNNTFFLVYFNVNNILNNENIVTNAYETGRIDRVGYFERNVDTFGSKYSYAYGRTYLISFILRMN